MTALRCTARLLKAMRAMPDVAPHPPCNRLGEWTANLIRVSRIALVIAVSEPMRYGVVIDAAPYASVPERFAHALWHALLELGVPADVAAGEVESMRPFQVAASTNKSVLGTLNQYAVEVEAALRYGDAHSAAALTRGLARTVILRPKNVGFPADRVREAFGLAPLDQRQRLQELLESRVALH